MMEGESSASKQKLDLTDSDMQLVSRWMDERIDGFIDFPLNMEHKGYPGFALLFS